MEQFFSFVINHWVLWLLFFLLVALLIWSEIYSRVAGFPRLRPQDVVNKVNHEHAVILDLREAKNFESGHILGSVNFPVNTIDSEAAQKKLKKYKIKNTILLAASDQQAVKLAHKFAQQGFTKLFIMQGGITAWHNANLPIVQK